MPTWLHILIVSLILISILLGGSVFFFLTGMFLLAVMAPIPLAVLVLWLFMKMVPARCPECGGKAYLKRSSEKRFYYECKDCGQLENAECSIDGDPK